MHKKSTILIFTVIVFVAFGCRRIPSSRHLLDDIYQNQKAYYEQSILNKNDYTNIIESARKWRFNFYRKHSINLNELGNFIILEGSNQATGYYFGWLLSEKASYFYNNYKPNEGMILIPIDSDSDSIVNKTKTSRTMINLVISWDTATIHAKNNELGDFSDAPSYMATRVTKASDGKVSIETIAFDQFPEP